MIVDKRTCLDILHSPSHNRASMYVYKNTIYCGMCFCHLAIKAREKTLFMYYMGVNETVRMEYNFIIKYCARLNFFFEGDELSYSVSSCKHIYVQMCMYIYTYELI